MARTLRCLISLMILMGSGVALAAVSDYDGDGKSDILWRNAATGADQLYLMNGTLISENLALTTVSADWQVAGRGDYNGDTKADILWRYTPTGALWIFLMDGNAVTASLFVATVADPDWRIVGDGDYTGDGNADILFRHRTLGTVWLYALNGNTITLNAGIGVVPNTDWKVVGSGDYNGDMKADILWRNIATGTNWLYLMDGATILTSVGISVTPDLNWEVVGNGDYDGDGKDDILWRNRVTGTNWLYLMDGTTILTSASISVLPDLNWQIVGDGDYNGDGKADVLWRNLSTGAVFMYLMDGLTIMANAQVSVVADQNWQVIDSIPPQGPKRLDGITLSDSTLTLDRWGDTATISTTSYDQYGDPINGATISWTSSDDTIADVDDAGTVMTWLGGDVTITAEATLNTESASANSEVNVAIQQNPNCIVPTEFPIQGPVNPPSLWEPRWVPTQVIPDTGVNNMVHRGIPLVLDADRDGDNDLLAMTNTPENQGIGIPIDTAHAVWLNNGDATFTDGTDAVLGQNAIPWSAPRNISYADFDADGFRDIMVFQQGWELAESCETPGGCPGGPNLLFLPQPGGLSDTAPSRLNPYDSAQFTHSGAVADVDCDGDIDILEAQWGVGGHHLQLNSGSGTFQANDSQLPQDVFTNVGISGSAMCDLDRDGDPDLVSVDGTVGVARPARISVNNGFGQFRMLHDEVLPSIEADDGLECGDLGLSGYPDVVLNGEALLNQGDMVFVLDASIDYTDIRNGRGVVDLNGDGWPDLSPEKNETLYWNTGGGVYTGSYMPHICCGSQPVVADLDMDGMPDIYLNFSSSIDVPNLVFLNRPSPAPVKLVFATTDLYTGDLGGLAGADGICQQHATNAGLPGMYVAYLSDSTTHALNRVSHGEYRRVGSGEVVVPSKLELFDTDVSVPVQNDENGSLIMADLAVRTGTEPGGRRLQAPGVGFCSDWTRDTNEDPGLAASGNVSGQLAFGGTWSGVDRPCSEPQRLYCFQQ